MSFSKMLIATAMMYASFDPGMRKLIRKYENSKPDYYKISLSKQERKGKTYEEIEQLRIEKYTRIKAEEKGMKLYQCVACKVTYEIPKEQESPLVCNECIKTEEARECSKDKDLK